MTDLEAMTAALGLPDGSAPYLRSSLVSAYGASRCGVSGTMTPTSGASRRRVAMGTAEAMETYERKMKIGEGSYGKVYKCVNRQTGEWVAVKQIQWTATDDGVPSFAIREVSLLQDVRHPYTVRLIETIADDSKLFLVFEFLEKDLKRMLDQRTTPIVGYKLKRIMFQLLSGLHACHSRRIVHRDIKLTNILVSKDESIVKLADFGLGKALGLPLQTYTHEVMTLLYRAPEILLGEQHYLPAVDMWSMGCVMAELARRDALFSGDGEWSMLTTIFQTLGTPNESTWPGVSKLPDYNAAFPQFRPSSLASTVPTLDEDGIDLLSRMLTYWPSRRITAQQALQHRWLDEVRAECEAELLVSLANESQEAE